MLLHRKEKNLLNHPCFCAGVVKRGLVHWSGGKSSFHHFLFPCAIEPTVLILTSCYRCGNTSKAYKSHWKNSHRGQGPGERPLLEKVFQKWTWSQVSITWLALGHLRFCDFGSHLWIAVGEQHFSHPIFLCSSFLHLGICDRIYSHSFGGAAFKLIHYNPDTTLLTSGLLGQWKTKCKRYISEWFPFVTK